MADGTEGVLRTFAADCTVFPTCVGSDRMDYQEGCEDEGKFFERHFRSFFKVYKFLIFELLYGINLGESGPSRGLVFILAIGLNQNYYK